MEALGTLLDKLRMLALIMQFYFSTKYYPEYLRKKKSSSWTYLVFFRTIRKGNLNANKASMQKK